MEPQPMPNMPLQTIITLMHIAAVDLNISLLRWLPPNDFEKGIIYEPYTICLNHLIKEALPWITRTYELKTQNDELIRKYEIVHERLTKLEEHNAFLQKCLDRSFP